MVDRLLLISSFLLVVLTFVFSHFMNAEQFYEEKVIDLELQLKLMEKNLNEQSVKFLQDKIKKFDEFHRGQEAYTRIFAGLMGVLLLITAVCFPIGVWRNSTRFVKVLTFILMVKLTALGMMGFLFAFHIWRP